MYLTYHHRRPNEWLIPLTRTEHTPTDKMHKEKIEKLIKTKWNRKEYISLFNFLSGSMNLIFCHRFWSVLLSLLASGIYLKWNEINNNRQQKRTFNNTQSSQRFVCKADQQIDKEKVNVRKRATLCIVILHAKVIYWYRPNDQREDLLALKTSNFINQFRWCDVQWAPFFCLSVFFRSVLLFFRRQMSSN